MTRPSDPAPTPAAQADPPSGAGGVRPRISWSDLAGRRVGLYGLGVEGRANLHACHARGIAPVVADDGQAGGTVDGLPIVTHQGLANCEIVIKSPGISRYSPAVQQLIAQGHVISSGLGLWLAETDLSRVLVVTGTKGKSTTAAIAGHLLSRWGYRALVGGNIGVPPYDPEAPEADYYVIETSSYQATDLPVSPPVTAVTSLAPDHLPWHGGAVERYYADKLSATSQPGAELTMANGDSDVLRAHAGLLGPRVEWVTRAAAEAAPWIAGLGLLGHHNQRNALIAARALAAMGISEALDEAALAAAARGFAGLPSRLTLVGSVGGVDFIDDGLSTNVLPVLAAVEAFPERRVALLVGGQSRGIDYAPLGVGLRARTVDLRIFTMPSNGAEIGAAVRAADPGPHVSVVDTDSLDDAVGQAAEWAAPHGVVLLSPAAPSFDFYRDYQERGAAFAAAIPGL